MLIQNGVWVETEHLDEIVYTDGKWAAFMLGQLLQNAARYRREEPVRNSRSRGLHRYGPLPLQAAGGRRVYCRHGRARSSKATLLNCISTIDAISAGNILLDTLTLEENIGPALTLNHADPKQVQNIVAQLGIGDILGKFP